jgi:hypothetical protein
MDGMHCFIDSTSILVKIKSVSLYNCRTVYIRCCIDTIDSPDDEHGVARNM